MLFNITATRTTPHHTTPHHYDNQLARILTVHDPLKILNMIRYDPYRGVINLVEIMSGKLEPGDKISIVCNNILRSTFVCLRGLEKKGRITRAKVENAVLTAP